jgi:hypothetical protein
MKQFNQRGPWSGCEWSTFEFDDQGGDGSAILWRQILDRAG